jgi:O-antigen/teichoic acid export membrane protein
VNRPSSLTTSSKIAQLRPGVLSVLRGTVAGNGTSLYSIQFASCVLPLVTVPYVVRVLKAERFGAVASGQGPMAYFMPVVECGFGLSATRRISAVRRNHEMVSRTGSDVIAARVMLCGGSLLLLVGFIHFVLRLLTWHDPRPLAFRCRPCPPSFRGCLRP